MNDPVFVDWDDDGNWFWECTDHSVGGEGFADRELAEFSAEHHRHSEH